MPQKTKPDDFEIAVNAAKADEAIEAGKRIIPGLTPTTDALSRTANQAETALQELITHAENLSKMLPEKTVPLDKATKQADDAVEEVKTHSHDLEQRLPEKTDQTPGKKVVQQIDNELQDIIDKGNQKGATKEEKAASETASAISASLKEVESNLEKAKTEKERKVWEGRKERLETLAEIVKENPDTLGQESMQEERNKIADASKRLTSRDRLGLQDFDKGCAILEERISEEREKLARESELQVSHLDELQKGIRTVGNEALSKSKDESLDVELRTRYAKTAIMAFEAEKKLEEKRQELINSEIPKNQTAIDSYDRITASVFTTYEKAEDSQFFEFAENALPAIIKRPGKAEFAVFLERANSSHAKYSKDLEDAFNKISSAKGIEKNKAEIFAENLIRSNIQKELQTLAEGSAITIQERLGSINDEIQKAKSGGSDKKTDFEILERARSAINVAKQVKNFSEEQMKIGGRAITAAFFGQEQAVEAQINLAKSKDIEKAEKQSVMLENESATLALHKLSEGKLGFDPIDKEKAAEKISSLTGISSEKLLEYYTEEKKEALQKARADEPGSVRQLVLDKQMENAELERLLSIQDHTTLLESDRKTIIELSESTAIDNIAKNPQNAQKAIQDLARERTLRKYGKDAKKGQYEKELEIVNAALQLHMSEDGTLGSHLEKNLRERSMQANLFVASKESLEMVKGMPIKNPEAALVSQKAIELLEDFLDKMDQGALDSSELVALSQATALIGDQQNGMISRLNQERDYSNRKKASEIYSKALGMFSEGDLSAIELIRAGVFAKTGDFVLSSNDAKDTDKAYAVFKSIENSSDFTQIKKLQTVVLVLEEKQASILDFQSSRVSFSARMQGIKVTKELYDRAVFGAETGNMGLVLAGRELAHLARESVLTGDLATSKAAFEYAKEGLGKLRLDSVCADQGELTSIAMDSEQKANDMRREWADTILQGLKAPDKKTEEKFAAEQTRVERHSKDMAKRKRDLADLSLAQKEKIDKRIEEEKAKGSSEERISSLTAQSVRYAEDAEKYRKEAEQFEKDATVVSIDWQKATATKLAEDSKKAYLEISNYRAKARTEFERALRETDENKRNEFYNQALILQQKADSIERSIVTAIGSLDYYEYSVTKVYTPNKQSGRKELHEGLSEYQKAKDGESQYYALKKMGVGVAKVEGERQIMQTQWSMLSSAKENHKKRFEKLNNQEQSTGLSISLSDREKVGKTYFEEVEKINAFNFSGARRARAIGDQYTKVFFVRNVINNIENFRQDLINGANDEIDRWNKENSKRIAKGQPPMTAPTIGIDGATKAIDPNYEVNLYQVGSWRKELQLAEDGLDKKILVQENHLLGGRTLENIENDAYSGWNMQINYLRAGISSYAVQTLESRIAAGEKTDDEIRQEAINAAGGESTAGDAALDGEKMVRRAGIDKALRKTDTEMLAKHKKQLSASSAYLDEPVKNEENLTIALADILRKRDPDLFIKLEKEAKDKLPKGSTAEISAEYVLAQALQSKNKELEEFLESAKEEYGRDASVLAYHESNMAVTDLSELQTRSDTLNQMANDLRGSTTRLSQLMASCPGAGTRGHKERVAREILGKVKVYGAYANGDFENGEVDLQFPATGAKDSFTFTRGEETLFVEVNYEQLQIDGAVSGKKVEGKLFIDSGSLIHFLARDSDNAMMYLTDSEHASDILTTEKKSLGEGIRASGKAHADATLGIMGMYRTEDGKTIKYEMNPRETQIALRAFDQSMQLRDSAQNFAINVAGLEFYALGRAGAAVSAVAGDAFGKSLQSDEVAMTIGGIANFGDSLYQGAKAAYNLDFTELSESAAKGRSAIYTTVIGELKIVGKIPKLDGFALIANILPEPQKFNSGVADFVTSFGKGLSKSSEKTTELLKETSGGTTLGMVFSDAASVTSATEKMVSASENIESGLNAAFAAVEYRTNNEGRMKEEQYVEYNNRLRYATSDLDKSEEIIGIPGARVTSDKPLSLSGIQQLASEQTGGVEGAKEATIAVGGLFVGGIPTVAFFAARGTQQLSMQVHQAGGYSKLGETREARFWQGMGLSEGAASNMTYVNFWFNFALNYVPIGANSLQEAAVLSKSMDLAIDVAQIAPGLVAGGVGLGQSLQTKVGPDGKVSFTGEIEGSVGQFMLGGVFGNVLGNAATVHGLRSRIMHAGSSRPRSLHGLSAEQAGKGMRTGLSDLMGHSSLAQDAQTNRDIRSARKTMSEREQDAIIKELRAAGLGDAVEIYNDGPMSYAFRFKRELSPSEKSAFTAAIGKAETSFVRDIKGNGVKDIKRAKTATSFTDTKPTEVDGKPLDPKEQIILANDIAKKKAKNKISSEMFGYVAISRRADMRLNALIALSHIAPERIQMIFTDSEGKQLVGRNTLEALQKVREKRWCRNPEDLLNHLHSKKPEDATKEEWQAEIDSFMRVIGFERADKRPTSLPPPPTRGGQSGQAPYRRKGTAREEQKRFEMDMTGRTRDEGAIPRDPLGRDRAFGMAERPPKSDRESDSGERPIGQKPISGERPTEEATIVGGKVRTPEEIELSEIEANRARLMDEPSYDEITEGRVGIWYNALREDLSSIREIPPSERAKAIAEKYGLSEQDAKKIAEAKTPMDLAILAERLAKTDIEPPNTPKKAQEQVPSSPQTRDEDTREKVTEMEYNFLMFLGKYERATERFRDGESLSRIAEELNLDPEEQVAIADFQDLRALALKKIEEGKKPFEGVKEQTRPELLDAVDDDTGVTPDSWYIDVEEHRKNPDKVYDEPEYAKRVREWIFKNGPPPKRKTDSFTPLRTLNPEGVGPTGTDRVYIPEDTISGKQTSEETLSEVKPEIEETGPSKSAVWPTTIPMETRTRKGIEPEQSGERHVGETQHQEEVPLMDAAYGYDEGEKQDNTQKWYNELQDYLPTLRGISPLEKARKIADKYGIPENDAKKIVAARTPMQLAQIAERLAKSNTEPPKPALKPQEPAKTIPQMSEEQKQEMQQKIETDYELRMLYGKYEMARERYYNGEDMATIAEELNLDSDEQKAIKGDTTLLLYAFGRMEEGRRAFDGVKDQTPQELFDVEDSFDPHEHLSTWYIHLEQASRDIGKKTDQEIMQEHGINQDELNLIKGKRTSMLDLASSLSEQREPPKLKPSLSAILGEKGRSWSTRTEAERRGYYDDGTENIPFADQEAFKFERNQELFLKSNKEKIEERIEKLDGISEQNQQLMDRGIRNPTLKSNTTLIELGAERLRAELENREGVPELSADQLRVQAEILRSKGDSAEILARDYREDQSVMGRTITKTANDTKEEYYKLAAKFDDAAEALETIIVDDSEIIDEPMIVQEEVMEVQDGELIEEDNEPIPLVIKDNEPIPLVRGNEPIPLVIKDNEPIPLVRGNEPIHLVKDPRKIANDLSVFERSSRKKPTGELIDAISILESQAEQAEKLAADNSGTTTGGYYQRIASSYHSSAAMLDAAVERRRSNTLPREADPNNYRVKAEELRRNSEAWRIEADRTRDSTDPVDQKTHQNASEAATMYLDAASKYEAVAAEAEYRIAERGQKAIKEHEEKLVASGNTQSMRERAQELREESKISPFANELQESATRLEDAAKKIEGEKLIQSLRGSLLEREQELIANGDKDSVREEIATLEARKEIAKRNPKAEKAFEESIERLSSYLGKQETVEVSPESLQKNAEEIAVGDGTIYRMLESGEFSPELRNIAKEIGIDLDSMRPEEIPAVAEGLTKEVNYREDKKALETKTQNDPKEVRDLADLAIEVMHGKEKNLFRSEDPLSMLDRIAQYEKRGIPKEEAIARSAREAYRADKILDDIVNGREPQNPEDKIVANRLKENQEFMSTISEDPKSPEAKAFARTELAKEIDKPKPPSGGQSGEAPYRRKGTAREEQKRFEMDMTGRTRDEGAIPRDPLRDRAFGMAERPPRTKDQEAKTPEQIVLEFPRFISVSDEDLASLNPEVFYMRQILQEKKGTKLIDAAKEAIERSKTAKYTIENPEEILETIDKVSKMSGEERRDAIALINDPEVRELVKAARQLEPNEQQLLVQEFFESKEEKAKIQRENSDYQKNRDEAVSSFMSDVISGKEDISDIIHDEAIRTNQTEDDVRNSIQRSFEEGGIDRFNASASSAAAKRIEARAMARKRFGENESYRENGMVGVLNELWGAPKNETEMQQRRVLIDDPVFISALSSGELQEVVGRVPGFTDSEIIGATRMAGQLGATRLTTSDGRKIFMKEGDSESAKYSAQRLEAEGIIGHVDRTNADEELNTRLHDHEYVDDGKTRSYTLSEDVHDYIGKTVYMRNGNGDFESQTISSVAIIGNEVFNPETRKQILANPDDPRYGVVKAFSDLSQTPEGRSRLIQLFANFNECHRRAGVRDSRPDNAVAFIADGELVIGGRIDTGISLLGIGKKGGVNFFDADRTKAALIYLNGIQGLSDGLTDKRSMALEYLDALERAFSIPEAPSEKVESIINDHDGKRVGESWGEDGKLARYKTNEPTGKIYDARNDDGGRHRVVADENGRFRFDKSEGQATYQYLRTKEAKADSKKVAALTMRSRALGGGLDIPLGVSELTSSAEPRQQPRVREVKSKPKISKETETRIGEREKYLQERNIFSHPEDVKAKAEKDVQKAERLARIFEKVKDESFDESVARIDYGADIEMPLLRMKKDAKEYPELSPYELALRTIKDEDVPPRPPEGPLDDPNVRMGPYGPFLGRGEANRIAPNVTKVNFGKPKAQADYSIGDSAINGITSGKSLANFARLVIKGDGNAIQQYENIRPEQKMRIRDLIKNDEFKRAANSNDDLSFRRFVKDNESELDGIANNLHPKQKEAAVREATTGEFIEDIGGAIIDQSNDHPDTIVASASRRTVPKEGARRLTDLYEAGRNGIPIQLTSEEAVDLGRMVYEVESGLTIEDAANKVISERPPRELSELHPIARELFEIANDYLSGDPDLIEDAQHQLMNLSPEEVAAIEYMITPGSEFRRATSKEEAMQIARELGNEVIGFKTGTPSPKPSIERLTWLALHADNIVNGNGRMAEQSFIAYGKSIGPRDAIAFGTIAGQMRAAKQASNARREKVRFNPEDFAKAYAIEPVPLSPLAKRIIENHLGLPTELNSGERILYENLSEDPDFTEAIASGNIEEASKIIEAQSSYVQAVEAILAREYHYQEPKLSPEAKKISDAALAFRQGKLVDGLSVLEKSVAEGLASDLDYQKRLGQNDYQGAAEIAEAYANLLHHAEKIRTDIPRFERQRDKYERTPVDIEEAANVIANNPRSKEANAQLVKIRGKSEEVRKQVIERAKEIARERVAHLGVEAQANEEKVIEVLEHVMSRWMVGDSPYMPVYDLDPAYIEEPKVPPISYEQVLRYGEEEGIKIAQGISAPKGGIGTLENIIIEGRVRFGMVGGLIRGDTAHFAGNHGPYYVIFDKNTPVEYTLGKHVNIPEEYHKAYVVPTEAHKQQIIKALDQAVELGLMTKNERDEALSKVYTYDEFVKVPSGTFGTPQKIERPKIKVTTELPPIIRMPVTEEDRNNAIAYFIDKSRQKPTRDTTMDPLMGLFNERIVRGKTAQQAAEEIVDNLIRNGLELPKLEVAESLPEITAEISQLIPGIQSATREGEDIIFTHSSEMTDNIKIKVKAANSQLSAKDQIAYYRHNIAKALEPIEQTTREAFGGQFERSSELESALGNSIEPIRNIAGILEGVMRRIDQGRSPDTARNPEYIEEIGHISQARTEQERTERIVDSAKRIFGRRLKNQNIVPEVGIGTRLIVMQEVGIVETSNVEGVQKLRADSEYQNYMRNGQFPNGLKRADELLNQSGRGPKGGEQKSSEIPEPASRENFEKARELLGSKGLTERFASKLNFDQKTITEFESLPISIQKDLIILRDIAKEKKTPREQRQDPRWIEALDRIQKALDKSEQKGSASKETAVKTSNIPPIFTSESNISAYIDSTFSNYSHSDQKSIVSGLRSAGRHLDADALTRKMIMDSLKRDDRATLIDDYVTLDSSERKKVANEISASNPNIAQLLNELNIFLGADTSRYGVTHDQIIVAYKDNSNPTAVRENVYELLGIKVADPWQTIASLFSDYSNVFNSTERNAQIEIEYLYQRHGTKARQIIASRMGISDAEFNARYLFGHLENRRAGQDEVLMSIVSNLDSFNGKITTISQEFGGFGAYKITLDGTRNVYVKTTNEEASRNGSDLSMLSGIPAPKITTHKDGTPLTYQARDQTSQWGYSEEIGSFEGPLRIDGDGTEIVVGTLQECAIRFVNENPRIMSIIASDRSAFYEEIGFALAGSYAIGMYDRHSDNLRVMLLEIKDPTPVNLQKVRDSGHTVYEENGKFFFLKIGNIDTDTGGNYNVVKQGDEFVFTGMSNRYGAHDIDFVFKDLASFFGTTAHVIRQEAFGSVTGEANGPIRQGIERWHRQFGSRSGYRNEVNNFFIQHEGEQSGLGRRPTQTDLDYYQRNGLIPRQHALNGDPVRFNDPYGRSTLRANYEIGTVSEIENFDLKYDIQDALPIGIEMFIMRKDNLSNLGLSEFSYTFKSIDGTDLVSITRDMLANADPAAVQNLIENREIIAARRDNNPRRGLGQDQDYTIRANQGFGQLTGIGTTNIGASPTFNYLMEHGVEFLIQEFGQINESLENGLN